MGQWICFCEHGNEHLVPQKGEGTVWLYEKLSFPCAALYITQSINSDAEPTDTIQIVIDNIWKQGKISETVYKYLQICYLLPTDYKLIFW